MRAAGLDIALSEALAPWRAPLARHDPAKVLLDLALALALGGEACSDLATVRAEPSVFGPVASDATLSRTITRLAGDAGKVLAAIGRARAAAASMTADAASQPRRELRRAPRRRRRTTAGPIRASGLVARVAVSRSVSQRLAGEREERR